jgi:hypothetical protein
MGHLGSEWARAPSGAAIVTFSPRRPKTVPARALWILSQVGSVGDGTCCRRAARLDSWSRSALRCLTRQLAADFKPQAATSDRAAIPLRALCGLVTFSRGTASQRTGPTATASGASSGPTAPTSPSSCSIPRFATREILDPTVRRCLGYANGWGAFIIDVVNIFGLVSPNPADLMGECNPVEHAGGENDFHIFEIAKRSALVIAAWAPTSLIRASAPAYMTSSPSCATSPSTP